MIKNKSIAIGNNNVIKQSHIGGFEEISAKDITVSEFEKIKLKRGKSIIKIGDSEKGGVDIKLEVITKFNWLQKKMCKYLLNIEIEDIKEELQ